MEVERPLPVITDETRPFWEGARRREFLAQTCTHCGKVRSAPEGICPDCLAEGGDWKALSGRGTISSWCVYHRAFHPAFASAVPYVIVQVDLEEGIRYIAPLVNGNPEDLRLGLPVEVDYEIVTDEVTLPVFRLKEGLA